MSRIKYDSFVKYHDIHHVLHGVLFGYVHDTLWAFMKHPNGHLVELLIAHPEHAERSTRAVIDDHLASVIQQGGERGLLKITLDDEIIILHSSRA